MRSLFKICNAAYWFALMLWVSVLVTAGIAAMNTFGRLTGMEMELKRFAALPLESHGRLAAGIVMEGVFFTVDLIQFVAAPLAIITLALQLTAFRMPWRRPANVVRGLCVIIAAGLFAYHASMLAPTMNRELNQYWNSAEAGDVASAADHLREFNALHPIAETILQSSLILLLIAVGASAAAFTPTRDASNQSSELQTPQLARRTP